MFWWIGDVVGEWLRGSNSKVVPGRITRIAGQKDTALPPLVCVSSPNRRLVGDQGQWIFTIVVAAANPREAGAMCVWQGM